MVWGDCHHFTFHRDQGTHPSPLPAYTTDDTQACKTKHQYTASNTCSNYHIDNPNRSFLCGRRKAFRHRNKENLKAFGWRQGCDANFHTHVVIKADLLVIFFYEVTVPQPCSTDVHLHFYFILLWLLDVHLSPIHTFPAQVGIGWEWTRDLAGQGHLGPSGEWPSRVSWDCKGKKRTCEWEDGKMGPPTLLWLPGVCSSSSFEPLLLLSPFITTSSILLCTYLLLYASWHWYCPEWLKWTLGSFSSMLLSGFLISNWKRLLFLVSCCSPRAVTLKSSSS